MKIRMLCRPSPRRRLRGRSVPLMFSLCYMIGSGWQNRVGATPESRKPILPSKNSNARRNLGAQPLQIAQAKSDAVTAGAADAGAADGNLPLEAALKVAEDPTSTGAEAVEAALATALGSPNVKLKVVTRSGDGLLVAILSGQVDPRQREGMKTIAGQFKTAHLIADFVSHFSDPVAAVAAVPVKEATEIWPLTFVNDDLSGQATPTQYQVQPIVDVLNQTYGNEKNKGPVQFVRNSLLLHATPEVLNLIKRQLVQLDAAGPQVQLDLWAIQISGKRGKAFSQTLQSIAEDVRVTQEALRTIPGLIQIRNADLNGAAMQSALAHMRNLGFDPNPQRHLSLNEKMIFIGLADQLGRQNIYQHLWEAFNRSPALVALWKQNGSPIRFRRSTQIYQGQTEDVKLDQDAIGEFVESADAFIHPPTATTFHVKDWPSARSLEEAQKLGSPSVFRTRSITADRLLKEAMDAFTADMQEMFLNPLIERLIQQQKKGDVEGISLVGRTRLVVTSGLQTDLSPSLSSFVETTRPAPLTRELLDMAFPRTHSGGAEDKTTTIATTDSSKPANDAVTSNRTTTRTASEGANDLSGVAGLVSGLPSAQAIALIAALNPPTPTFAEVAPGIGITVRPAVLPDGGSARLQINMHFGVSTSAFEGNSQAKNGLATPHADAVKVHQVSTDAIVSAFDLFDVSSFDISTSSPRSPGYIPVLGALPIVGPAFQWRRKATLLEHHSLILMNTVILPRALNLAQFYASSEAAP